MINGKELMIGDYVAIAEYDSLGVGVVKEIHADGEEMCISIDGQVCDVLADKDISALFLSKIFFLENGFEVLNETYSLLYNGDIKVVIKLYKGDSFKCEVNGIKIEYVHEFQHLMRLLGLSEYANNLKV